MGRLEPYKQLAKGWIGLFLYFAGIIVGLTALFHALDVGFASDLSIWTAVVATLAGLAMIRVGAEITGDAVDRLDRIEKQRGENQG